MATTDTNNEINNQNNQYQNVGGVVSSPMSGKRSIITKWQFWVTIILLLLLVLNSAAVTYLLYIKKPTTVTVLNDSGDDTSKVLSVDIPGGSVGVGTTKPQGLQVGSSVQSNARGEPNVRLGLLNGTPVILFEGNDSHQWQLGLTGNGISYGEVGQPAAVVASSQNSQVTTTLGNKSDSKVVLMGTSVATPNNLSINNNSLYVDATRNQVTIGGTDSHSYKLYVAGNLGTSSTITAGDQILAVNGTAAKPGLTFQGVTSSGLYASGNSVSVTAKGTETLKVSPNSVQVIGNLQTEGYIRAGTGTTNPAWQLKRLTGTVTGPDMYIAHGVTASNKILLIDAYYLDSTGKAQPIFDYYDNSVIHLVNGIEGRPYTITVVYSEAGAGW